MPKISVIMGVYNGSKKIDFAIKSILNQTFSDFELIICDDGSSDNSYEIIKNYEQIDKRVKVIKNEKNMGLAPTLNKCLEIAEGEYIARMDDDDISHKNRFAKQVEFLDKHTEYALVGTSSNLYDRDGIWGSNINEGERTKLDIYLGRTFIHPSVMMRREAILDVGGYTTGQETERTEDFDLWCKLYSKGYKGYNLSDILLDYYEARDCYKKRKFKYRICEYRLKKKWRKELNIPLMYIIYAYRPLIVGILPGKIYMRFHRKRIQKK